MPVLVLSFLTEIFIGKTNEVPKQELTVTAGITRWI